MVGRYEIVRRIGAGGMAEVYLARLKSAPEARVAIKRMLPEFANEPRFIEMFVAEARLAATLQHPSIARVFDVGVDHGSCYYVMEYIHGQDVVTLLAAALAKGSPMPLPIALSVMYGVTTALAYVHDQNGLNVVHRDISPSNILVSFDGAIKLVDFGIARVESSPRPRTSSGQIKGKIPYMSPEQCRARPLDGRSDLFSLGVTLYELTTNRRPFDRATEFLTLEAIVRGDYVWPSQVMPGYPKDLEEVVVRLMATRPADRYPTAGALLVDLDRIIAAHGIEISDSALAGHIERLLGRGSSAPGVQHAVRLATVPGGPDLGPPPTAVLSPAARAPIDRIVARCDALLESIAPGTTDARDLPAGAVAQLIGRALKMYSRGDLEETVLALELALSAARPDDGIDELLASNESLIMIAFNAYIGDQKRMAAMSQHLEELVGVAIDQRAAFLLTRIDGTLSVGELLATCGLPPREACRHLSQLMLRQLVVLV
jgi:hypothetical protein